MTVLFERARKACPLFCFFKNEYDISMIDPRLIREEPDKIKEGIAAKNADPKLVDTFLELDRKWREALTELENWRSEQKKLSAARDIEGGKRNKETIKELESKVADLEKEKDAALVQIPNPPLPSVPRGKSEADSQVLREAGEKPQFSFKPKDYFEIAEALNLIDTKRAAKVSGSRFGYILGDAARMEFALGQLLFETVGNPDIIRGIIQKNNLDLEPTPFIPVLPPVLINHASMSGMGYMERGGEEIYYLPKDDLYLIGTSEQAIGPMHQGETFDRKDLPKRYVGFSACFRREAGSYGKDTKGILRVHQFNKFEMFSFSPQEKSEEEHKLFLAIEEYLMQKLGLPYHVLNICSADLGDPAAAKYDIEAWFPGQREGVGEYRETHSTSNTTDFQARRLNIRYKDKNETKFAHLINGTAFSERPILAIIENYQTEEGKVKIPEALRPYLGGKELIG